MAAKPEATTVKVTDAEVIDPHFLFRIKNIKGQNMVDLIPHFMVTLRYLGADSGPGDDKDYINMLALSTIADKFQEKKPTDPCVDGNHYYEKGDQYFTVIVDFIDSDFKDQDFDDRWVATIAYDKKTFAGWKQKHIKCNPDHIG